MSRHTIQANNQLYTYSPDDPVPVGRRSCGVVSAQLVDEITGLQPNGTPFIATEYKGLRPRIAQESSLVGLVGIPVSVFPNLKSQGYPVVFSAGAEEYIPRGATANVPRDTAYPDSFHPASLLTLELHRQAVGIRGRAVKIVGTGTQAVSGATVRLTWFWTTSASTSIPPPLPPEKLSPLLALQPSLYFDRSAPNSTIHGRTMTLPGDAKTLLVDAVAGSSIFRLSDAVNILQDDLLIVDDDDPERTEYMKIAAGGIPSAAAQNQPATLPLTHALASTHRAGATVRRAILNSAAVFTQHINRNALTGDSLVFLDDIASIVGDSGIVDVTDSSQVQEFHHFRKYSVTSGGEGYFQLPPISRVAQVRIQATHTALASPPKLVNLQYGGADNRVDFVFR